MILNFPGGIRPEERTRIGKRTIENINTCSAVCIEAHEGFGVVAKEGTTVKRGDLIGENAGTPVFASITGKFNGVAEVGGSNYFVIIGNGSEEEKKIFSPESRRLTEMSEEDIVECAQKFGIVDSRSGRPLWEILEEAGSNCRRLVIDCTECDPNSAINYRLCIEKTKSLVGGAKVLLRATGALKCVFAAEHYRKAALTAILGHASDEKLFAIAELDEKYPYTDRTLMYALYVKPLERNETPLDHGVCIIGAETAVALYDSMLNGVPYIDRYVSLCGEGLPFGTNCKAPRGITLRDLTEICKIQKKNRILIENSVLSGSLAKGALSDSARAVISVLPKNKIRTICISCGRCADACPVRLIPSDVLAKDNDKLFKYCVSCGACEYICPSGIPLMSLIKHKALPKEESQNSALPEVLL